MAVLSDTDILALISGGALKIGGFEERNLTPNGYDVTVEQIMLPAFDRKTTEGLAAVPPMAWIVIGTREYLELPANIVGEIWIRTTWVRKGILSSFGRIDAGFHGNLTFSALNVSDKTVEIPIGERFAQVVFEELRSPPKKSYAERSGNYQGQRGITLAPASRNGPQEIR
ncbi:MAG TPA: dCTP deaminase [Thermoplasmata archaeon]